MDSLEIYKIITEKERSDYLYEVFAVDDGKCFFGIDQNGFAVFMLPSKVPQMTPVFQETKALKYIFNNSCMFNYEGVLQSQIMHVLCCKDTRKDSLVAFIRLTRAFACSEEEANQRDLTKLFSSLSSLFDKQKTTSSEELQGLFAELFVILFFNDNGANISGNWQSKDKMKFDFTIDDDKRLEVKSTIKEERVHHFLHEQLSSDIYDIKIASVMLRKSDSGLSLKDIVERVRKTFPFDFNLQNHLETKICHVSDDELKEMMFDEKYTFEQLKIVDAKNVPHFNQKTPDGVFRPEYDSDLSTVSGIELTDMLDWLRQN